MLSTERRPTQLADDALIARDLGDEYLFYDTSGDRVHVLNGTARAIYILCDGQRSETELAGRFAEMYRIDLTTAERDIKETLERLVELGLIQVS